MIKIDIIILIKSDEGIGLSSVLNTDNGFIAEMYQHRIPETFETDADIYESMQGSKLYHEYTETVIDGINSILRFWLLINSEESIEQADIIVVNNLKRAKDLLISSGYDYGVFVVGCLSCEADLQFISYSNEKYFCELCEREYFFKDSYFYTVIEKD